MKITNNIEGFKKNKLMKLRWLIYFFTRCQKEMLFFVDTGGILSEPIFDFCELTFDTSDVSDDFKITLFQTE